MKKYNVYTAIVSITFEFAIEVIANKLGADYYVGTNFNGQGNITHFWPEDKVKWLESLMISLNTGFDEVAAIGDSWGDVYMLNRVRYSYFVGKNKPEGLNAIHRARYHCWNQEDRIAEIGFDLHKAIGIT